MQEAKPNGQLIVSRTKTGDIGIRNIEVFIDGEFSGDLAYGSELMFSLEPGSHTLRATNKMNSKKATFDIDGSEPVRFQVVAIQMGCLWHLVSMLGTVPYRVELSRSD